jgi:hypothetical protein
MGTLDVMGADISHGAPPIELGALHQAVQSVPPCSPGSISEASGRSIFSTRGGAYASSVGSREAVATLSSSYIRVYPFGELGSPGSSISIASFLEEKKSMQRCLNFFPEVSWVLGLGSWAGFQHHWPAPKRYRAFRAATAECVKLLGLLLCICGFFAWITGFSIKASLLTTLQQSVVFLLPIPFHMPTLLCFVSAVVAWPRLSITSKHKPPVISPRATDLSVQAQAYQELEDGEYVHEPCLRHRITAKHRPLIAAARLTRAAALLWCRHEVYLLVSCLSSGVGLFCATTVDAVLCRLLGPGPVLLYPMGTRVRVSGTAAIVVFSLGSVVLTLGCVVGVFWAWIVAVFAWLQCSREMKFILEDSV